MDFRDARGPLIEEYLTKYPVRFATPAFIGVLAPDEQNVLANGTATLLQIGDRRLLVTNDHVIVKYEEYKRADSRVRFQIGDAPFDPVANCIDRNREKDLFTIAVTDEMKLTTRDDENMPPIEYYRFTEEQWPPSLASQGQSAIFGGFPGGLRSQSGFEVTSESYTVAAVQITGVLPTYFTCNLDRAEWRLSDGSVDQERVQYRDWGGMSGGPVMVDGAETLRPMLVGFISEYQRDLDQLKATHLANIKADGTIEKGSLF